jgi:acetyl-CoA carboxylase biotin carboxylase subunit
MRIRRILIANRGEIAMRIIRTCQSLGIETVLVVSEADRDSLPARTANKVLCIGPAPSSTSYLQVGTILTAALGVKADAIHPGYGFLSEREIFARTCEQEGMCFIGPTADQIAAVGDKLRAREHAKKAKVPIVPGGGPVSNGPEAVSLAREIGFPVLIKAVGGGGGRGMKRANSAEELPGLIDLAISEASAAFGDPRVYLERFVTKGRHVEVQLLGDGGRLIHLGDRDCSIQRRFQKLIEEAPAPDIDPAIRGAMHRAAVRLGKHLRYRSLGTVEFLLDVDRQEFYFLEMNARIQVEHPVTEMITGIDVVAEQIAVAEGHPLRIKQSDVILSGHSIECRLNAEDVANDFRPSPGTIVQASFPDGQGVRVDTHIETGTRITPYYDSLLAKIIVHASDRPGAVQRMQTALRECRIDGLATNLSLHATLMADASFAKGAVDTGFLPALLEARRAYGTH